MKLPSQKLDFLLIYVVISITAISVIRMVIVHMLQWMEGFPAKIMTQGGF